MATYTEDWSAEAVAAHVVDGTLLNGLSQWTWNNPVYTAGVNTWYGSIKDTGGGNHTGKYLSIIYGGFGGTSAGSLTFDPVASLGAGVETDVLVKWRATAGGAQTPIVMSWIPAFLRGLDITDSTAFTRYGVICEWTSGTDAEVNLRRVSGAASQGASVTSYLQNYTPDPDYRLWHWIRINVTAAGAWSWKIWVDAAESGGVTEPGSWDRGPTSNTTNTDGYVGISWGAYGGAPYDIGYWSLGVGSGASAPSPGASQSPVPVMINNYQR